MSCAEKNKKLWLFKTNICPEQLRCGKMKVKLGSNELLILCFDRNLKVLLNENLYQKFTNKQTKKIQKLYKFEQKKSVYYDEVRHVVDSTQK